MVHTLRNLLALVLFTTLCAHTSAQVNQAAKPDKPVVNKTAKPEQTKPKLEQQAKTKVSDATLSQAPGVAQNLLDIKLSTSRSAVTGSNDSYSVAGIIQNNGKTPVTLSNDKTVLWITPEASVEKQCSFSVAAFFPTENGSPSKITIPAGEQYQVSWDVSPSTTHSTADEQTGTKNPCTSNVWQQVTGFVPGKYTLYADVNPVWAAVPDPDNTAQSSPTPEPYHTYSKGIEVNVVLSEWLAMLFAGVGGLLAFTLAWFRGKTDVKALPAVKGVSESLVWIWVALGNARQAVAAMLMSSVISVLASRLSETALPIKISVADGLGALSLGFVAYFVGGKFLDALAGKAEPGKNPPPVPGAPVAPPQVGNG